MKQSEESVCVGLSGGVDSSVAATRLLRAGYAVTGVFIKTWQPDFLVCNWEAERLDAMRVAAKLGIPFLTCDATEAYRVGVAEYMIREYQAGRTPNPDVMCNREVKFGIFKAFMSAHGFSKLATGHYAQIRKEGDSYHLYRGADQSKDQSYFLWTLTQAQLAVSLFPVGDTTKVHIRKEAILHDLPTQKKADSQGVCFLGEIDMKEFLTHYNPQHTGAVLDTTGATIGTHDGALFYTLGQRHGFIIQTATHHNAPYYVVEKDLERNTITVSHHPRYVHDERITLTQLHCIQGALPPVCEAQFRYRQKPFRVSCEYTEDGRGILEVHDSRIERPSPGQSCVFYNGAECLGGGIVA